MSALYLDHAATSWPKAPGVAEAMVRALETSTSPGRSAHALSLAAAALELDTREALAALLGVGDPRRVVFTASCTEAINLVLAGTLAPGAHVVTTALEHNAVARPLRALEETREVRLTIVPSAPDGRVRPEAVAAFCTDETALLVVNHGSNVCGAVQDIAAIRRLVPGVPMLVDASQTAGVLPIDVDRWGLDYVALAGHKGLQGPAGVGALALGPDARLPDPLVHGGTGSRSEDDRQPPFLPDRLEAGTPNVPGIAGLGAGLAHLRAVGPGAIWQRERAIAAAFLEGAASVPGLRVVGPPAARDGEERLAVFSLVLAGHDPGRVALRLEREHGILVRAGLHCAPWAHRALGTFPTGTVRIAFGLSTPPEGLDRLLAALRALTGA